MRYLNIVLVLLLTASCSPKTTVVENTGISGKVVWTSGNQMPGLGRKFSAGKGIQREVYIYEPTQKSQVEGTGLVYNKVNSKLVK